MLRFPRRRPARRGTVPGNAASPRRPLTRGLHLYLGGLEEGNHGPVPEIRPNAYFRGTVCSLTVELLLSNAFANTLRPEITHKRMRPCRPQDNGKVGRLNLTVISRNGPMPTLPFGGQLSDRLPGLVSTWRLGVPQSVRVGQVGDLLRASESRQVRTIAH